MLSARLVSNFIRETTAQVFQNQPFIDPLLKVNVFE